MFNGPTGTSLNLLLIDVNNIKHKCKQSAFRSIMDFYTTWHIVFHSPKSERQ